MPRAFCPECGSEVPVDAEGVCHVGHLVDVAGASVAAAGELDVRFAEPSAPASDPDEPEPWVASVEEAAVEPDAPGPPPGSPASAPPVVSAPADEPAWRPDETAATPDELTRPEPHEEQPHAYEVPSADDDLAAAAAAAAAALSEPGGAPDDEDEFEDWEGDIESGIAAPGWSPPGDPIAPPPQPPPAPAEPPQPIGPAPRPAAEDTGTDFDLDDLEAAVDAMSQEPRGGRDYPADDISAAATFQELAGDRSSPGPSPADTDAPARPATPPPPPAEPSGEAPPPRSTPPSSPEEAQADDVDLSNFTARGGKRGGGEKRGRFRRG